MNFFSKIFQSSSSTSDETPVNDVFEELKLRFNDQAEFFTNVTIFRQKEKKTLNYIMIHPHAGLVLFNFFNHSAAELDGVTASPATDKTTNADIKTSDDKNFIELRFDEVFHTQISPVRSILICPNLSEGEFDYLDESFHQLIPKSLALFNDSKQDLYDQVVLGKEKNSYDTDKIKQALFAELILPEQNFLMSNEQQNAVFTEIKECLNIKGFPGSGKSSILIAKALYEKMKDPSINMIIFAKLSCDIHHLQSLIFQFIENSHWSLNPAEITVSSFGSMQKRLHDKERYELIVCDDANEADLNTLKKLLNRHGRLLLSSSYEIDDIKSVPLLENHRLSPVLCAACEGLEVEHLSKNLSLKSGNTFMNVILILEELLQSTSAKNITIAHYNKEELLQLQTEIDSYFTPISYQFDDQDKKEGIILYPLSHISCIVNEYVIVIIDENPQESLIQLISRARIKSFVLSESEDVYQLINHIKGEYNESD
jgi:hypothetical protein